ncbi:MAG: hypothetical protein OWT28_12580 [Firmicutes bacterium]|nr:hypothetical protein [Bacillota bacterium]
MRNARTLIERMTLSKSIDGELHTFDVDLHEEAGQFLVYVYDPEEAFASNPFYYTSLQAAKQQFERYLRLIVDEPVRIGETAADFGERIYNALHLTD